MIILGKLKDYRFFDFYNITDLDSIFYAEDVKILNKIRKYCRCVDLCYYDFEEGVFVNNIQDECYGENIILIPDGYEDDRALVKDYNFIRFGGENQCL